MVPDFNPDWHIGVRARPSDPSARGKYVGFIPFDYCPEFSMKFSLSESMDSIPVDYCPAFQISFSLS
jgi:hypothetical protein